MYQVHLPDDKDKRIIYDEAKGKWVNLDEDEDTAVAAAPPTSHTHGVSSGRQGRSRESSCLLMVTVARSAFMAREVST